MNKLLLLTIIAFSLAACGPADKEEQEAKQNNTKTAEKSTDESTTKETTTEQPAIESSTTEEPTTEAPQQETAPSYPVTTQDGLAYIELPSIKDPDFAQQILSNSFNIDGVQVNKSADYESILGTPAENSYINTVSYSNFDLGTSGRTITKIALDVNEQNISIQDLRNAWNKPYRTANIGQNGFPVDVYDGIRTNNYHIEVLHHNDEVMKITIYQGDTREEDVSPEIDVLSNDFIETFNKTPEQNLGGIYVGMKRQELLNKFGLPDSSLGGEGDSFPKYGNIIIRISDDEVDLIGVNPSDITTDDLLEVWGEPTEDNSEMGPSPAFYIYNSNPNNGYMIVVYHNGDTIYEIIKTDEP